MPVNKMNSDLLLVRLSWRRLSWYQRKRLFVFVFIEVQKARMKKCAAVIVSACVRAWRDLCESRFRHVPACGGACVGSARGDRADGGRALTVKQLYTLATDTERQQALFEMMKIIEKRRRREQFNAVIVSACVWAWCDLCAAGGVFDLLPSLLFIVGMIGSL